MKWMLKCRENTLLYTKSLDQKVSIIQRMQIKMHLSMCEVCNRYAKQLDWIDQAFRKKISNETLSQEAIDHICEKLKG
jgi:hypothetical protein